eukprot:GEZU01032370.1.p2 GENE.GEZU01032370.1~~GEZU01032370.1.p2  ORF type:complete len:277 (+),score=137.73 GEZU01032370.1:159-989(+)
MSQQSSLASFENNNSASNHPLATLTDLQKDKIKQLRAIADTWGMAEPEQKFCDDMCLYRYLKGLNWDVEISQNQLKETVEWRAKFKPQNITLEDVAPVAKQGYMFTHGFDKEGRPVMYMLMGKDTLDNSEENTMLKFKMVVYMMERAIERMADGVYSLTWIIDMKDSNLSLSTVKATKDMFGELGNFYTERLCRTLVINAPWSISTLWSFASKFLAKETRDKYIFVKGSPQQLKDIFTQYIDEDQLIVDYYGKDPYTYNYEKELEKEKAKLAGQQQ